MRIFRTSIMTLLALLYVSTVSAQQLTSQQKESMGRRAAQKVGQMNDYISQMAKKKTRGVSKKDDLENRLYIKGKALNLFIGRGFDYIENEVSKKGVYMQTTSLRNPQPVSTLMRVYFQRLIELKYTDVDIKSTEIAAIKVSNMNKIDDNTWVCTCEYDQVFKGFRDGRAVYDDITTKRIKCYLKVEQTVNGEEFIVLLGDVDAIQTKKRKV